VAVGGRVRVTSLSLWGRDGPAQDRATQVVGTLAELWPDVVCLQEVWRNGHVTQADVIAKDHPSGPLHVTTSWTGSRVTVPSA
jgi:hypothetical protein